jgi:hypothetical protein
VVLVRTGEIDSVIAERRVKEALLSGRFRFGLLQRAQYAPALKGEFVSRSIRLQARPNTEPQFCGLEIVRRTFVELLVPAASSFPEHRTQRSSVNAVLTMGGVAFERQPVLGVLVSI